MRVQFKLPAALRRSLADLKLSMVGLKPSAGDLYPAELSGGMRKRAGLARALALDPEILLLDEPTAGLDPIAASEIDTLITMLRHALNLSVFLVTHDLDTLNATCNRIAVLAGGKVQVTGTLAQMQKVTDPWVRFYFQGPRAHASHISATLKEKSMETKANYVLIGAFTLLAILAGLGFFVWLAKVQINKTYTQYDILFDQVSGLGQSSTVTFNGVNVGKVLTIALDRAKASQVRVRIEVAANTPIRVGTEATLASQGVTSVSYVGLEGGDVKAMRLPVDPVTGVAEIPSKTTVVQGLLADAPDLLAQAISVLNDMGRFTTPENADHVTQILANLNTASDKLTGVMDDLTQASANFSAAADKISAFSTKLDAVAANADATLTEAHAALADARTAIGHVDTFAAQGLPQIAGDAARLMADLSALTASIRRDPARFFLGNRTPEYSR